MTGSVESSALKGRNSDPPCSAATGRPEELTNRPRGGEGEAFGMGHGECTLSVRDGLFCSDRILNRPELAAAVISLRGGAGMQWNLLLQRHYVAMMMPPPWTERAWQYESQMKTIVDASKRYVPWLEGNSTQVSETVRGFFGSAENEEMQAAAHKLKNWEEDKAKEEEAASKRNEHLKISGTRNGMQQILKSGEHPGKTVEQKIQQQVKEALQAAKIKGIVSESTGSKAARGVHTTSVSECATQTTGRSQREEAAVPESTAQDGGERVEQEDAKLRALPVSAVTTSEAQEKKEEGNSYGAPSSAFVSSGLTHPSLSLFEKIRARLKDSGTDNVPPGDARGMVLHSGAAIIQEESVKLVLQPTAQSHSQMESDSVSPLSDVE